MFTVVKVREDLAPSDYRDPGWYKHPPGTVAYEVNVAQAGEPPAAGAKNVPEWTCRHGPGGHHVTTKATPKEKPHAQVCFRERHIWKSWCGGACECPLAFAVAHEDHEMECTETDINAMNADIQAMNDGEAKTTAMKEMEMAEDMMGNKDMNACVTHMHNAMEAMEE